MNKNNLKLDYLYYIQKQLQNPIEQLFEYIAWHRVMKIFKRHINKGNMDKKGIKGIASFLKMKKRTSTFEEKPKKPELQQCLLEDSDDEEEPPKPIEKKVKKKKTPKKKKDKKVKKEKKAKKSKKVEQNVEDGIDEDLMNMGCLFLDDKPKKKSKKVKKEKKEKKEKKAKKSKKTEQLVDAENGIDDDLMNMGCLLFE